MKFKTALQNIEVEKQRHENAMRQLNKELEESIKTTIDKERGSLINKFAKTFVIAPEIVEKKILPKSKRQCDAIKIEEMRKIHENQAIMYKQIVHDGEKYYYQKKEGGIVFKKNNDNNDIIIVGYMNGVHIVFTTVNNSDTEKLSV